MKFTMTKEEFTRISNIIESELDAFIESVAKVEEIYKEEGLITQDLVLSVQKIKEDLMRQKNKEKSLINNMILGSNLLAVDKFVRTVKDKISTKSPEFKKQIEALLLKINKIFEFNPNTRQILHRIWFGSMIPENYQNHILKFKELNPEFKIIIWTDFNNLKTEEIQDFTRFCNDNKILLKNIREHPYFVNFDLIIEELNAAQRAPKEKFRYARASDLARISILINQGGIYTDTDTRANEELYSPELPFGFVIKYENRT